MKKQQFLKIWFALVALVTMGEQNSWADPVAYAQYDGWSLQFYYGEMPEYDDNVWDVTDTGNNMPEWYTNGAYQSISYVRFDESFAEARPKSCFAWFALCYNISNIDGLEYLNTSEVTNMGAMFCQCFNLNSLDLTKFDTSNVQYMSQMFQYCYNLQTLDLSNFNTSNVINTSYMFSDCNSLRTIKVGGGWTMANVEQEENMFQNCYSLVGLSGTTFNSSHTGKDYARIDGGTRNPGYLSADGYLIAVEETENGSAALTVDGAEAPVAKAGQTVVITTEPADGYCVDEVKVVAYTSWGGAHAPKRAPQVVKDIAVTDNGDGTYSFEMPDQQVQITVTFKQVPAEVTTAPVAKELTYTGEALELVEAGVANGGEVQYALDGETFSATLPTATDAGTYTVTYKAVGDASHTDSETATLQVTIAKADVVLTAPTVKTLTYTGEAQELLNAGTAEGGELQYSSDGVAFAAAIPTATDAGTYAVYYQVVADANHNDVAPVELTAVISKADATLTAPVAKTLTYMGVPQALAEAGSAAGGNLVYSLDNETFEAAVPSATDAGTYTVYYKVVADANHNEPTAGSINVTIAKADAVMVAPTAKALIFTGEAQELVNAGIVLGGELQYALDGETFAAALPQATSAGSYTVSYKVVGDANHNDVAVATVEATIAKADVSIVAPTAKALIFTGEAQELVNAGIVQGGEMQYSLDGETFAAALPTATNAGAYTVSYKVTGDADHNDGASGSVAVIIEKAAATVTTAPVAKTLTYTGEAQELVEAGVAEGGSVLYSLDGTYFAAAIPTAVEAGLYTVSYKVVGDANHTDIDAVELSVAIVAAEVADPTITVGEAADGEVPSITVEVEGTTLTEGEDYTITYKDSEGNEVTVADMEGTPGTYTAVITFKGNYSGTAETTVTVTETVDAISTVAADNSADEGAWYTIDGRQLNSKPTHRGVFIHNGKKYSVGR